MTDTRDEFEKWISSPPIEQSVDRWSNERPWPGQYCDYRVQMAWEGWQAATAAERERCRILCNRISLEFERQGRDARAEAAEECAAAIRRGE